MPATRSRSLKHSLEEVPLPTEVVCHILQYLTFQDLLKYRSVNRSWNDAACQILRTQSYRTKTIIEVSNRQSIQQMMILRTTAIQPNFFTKFHLVMSELNISIVSHFANEFGASIRELILDTRKKQSSVKRIRDKVVHLLGHCPMVETLTIIGKNDGTCFMEDLDETLDFSRVKSFTLKSPYDAVLSIISHKTVLDWVTKLKVMRRLSITSTLDPSENGKLHELLGRIGSLDHLSVAVRFNPENRDIFRRLTYLKLRIHVLNLVVDMDEDDDQNLLFLNLYTWLAWQSRFLTQVTHQLHTRITDLPIINKLRTMGQPLRTAGRAVQPFRQDQSSSLYFVSVLSNDPESTVISDDPEPHSGIFANMEESIVSINRKTSKILKYLFPNMKLVHSTHYFVA